ncbi:MAG: membrane protein insertase YidC [Planctomycetota bacterium]|jgi:YidC/Oxa1 family membrane protein insertase
MRIVLTLIVVGFCLVCGWLVADSGLFESSAAGGKSCILLQRTTANEGRESAGAPAPKAERLEAAGADFRAFGGPAEPVILGAKDPCTEDPDLGFKLQLELSSKGAAIRKATFSNGNDNGFDDRDYKNPQPLVILSPVGGDILSMAVKQFVLVQHQKQFDLDKLSWKRVAVGEGYDGCQTAQFEAIIKDPAGEPVVRLTQTFKICVGSYQVDCDLVVENRTGGEQEVRFGLTGPVGIGREGIRGDMRKVVGGFFVTSKEEVVSSRKGIQSSFLGRKIGLKDATVEYQEALRTGNRMQIEEAKKNLRIGRNLPRRYKPADFLWAAATNKYFAAILRPVPGDGKIYCDWVVDKTGRFYNPDGDERANSGDETVGVDFRIASSIAANSSLVCKFQLYLGPKDKSLFDKNEQYKNLGFVQTIDFMGCCCPASIIRPLAFGILALMKWMYGFIHNYGVVIIILVFLFRLAIHPVTKKSQVSMSKMSKLAPKVEEIKKKYANNKAEMNKRMMALYKEQGASPIMGMLPMMVQMPIWIALWSAVYASVELRGAPFLPFWITDLSVPDALFRFGAVTLPLFGKLDSFNLLPILMGVAFYLQQKLMPSQAATSPQAAQQQKMMKIMLPLLFPLMLYKGPSGVNLYIMSSVFAGVFEQHIIRKHIREKEDAESKGLVAATSKTGGKVKKKKPKPFYRNM